MHFDSLNVAKEIENLNREFKVMDETLSNIETLFKNASSNIDSPSIQSFKSCMNTIGNNHDILINHFANIEEYLKTVIENYDSF